jgi:uncharacterized protein (TIGR02594 family)
MPTNVYDWKAIQTRLKSLGFYTGKIDGDRGPLTNKAIIAFKRSVGLNPRDYYGPITHAALMEKKPVPGPETVEEPCWLRRARMEIGTQEIPGSRHNARILTYWELTKLYFKTDEVAWCAGFVGAMIELCGLRSTRSGMARSYSDSPFFRKIDKPVIGCIVVYWRGSRTGSLGHVGFFTGYDQYRNIMTLGGNQSDAVNIKPFDDDRLLGFYWPVGVPLPGEAPVVTVTSNGVVSTNEA